MQKLLSILLASLFILSSGLTAFAETDDYEIDDDFDYFGSIPWELPDDAVPMRVDKVHDADSINLTEPDDDWYEQFRIVGIQAPEIEGYKEEECYGPESAAFAKALVPEGSIVWIQQDISDKDPNGRFLRHVFIQDEETEEYYLLSEVLVRGGFARQRTYKPDDLYDDVLIEAQEYAWENPENMWTCDEWQDLIKD